MSHTDEPWSYCEDNDGWCIENGVEQLGILFGEDNARRIVACVNACAGMPIKDLEAVPEKGLFRLAEFANKTVIERDTYRELCGELLFALKDIYFNGNCCATDLTAVITKAEQLLGESK